MPRKKIDSVMEECLALVFPIEQTAKQALWEKLWQQHMQEEKRQSTHPEIAELLTSTGAWLAYERGEYQIGHDLLTAFLRSSQADEINYTSRAILMGMQFEHLLFLRREADALQVVLQLLNAPRASDISFNVTSLQAHLGSYFLRQKSHELASAAITQLFYDLLRRTLRKKLKSIPHQATYGDLLALLIEASEAKERAREKRQKREDARKATA